MHMFADLSADETFVGADLSLGVSGQISFLKVVIFQW